MADLQKEGNMVTPITVQAPDRLPLPYGLFSQLTFRGEGERWLYGGVSLESLPCSRPKILDADVCTEEDFAGFTLEHLGTGTDEDTVWKPFTIYAIAKCSPVGRDLDTPTKALAHFYNIEQTQVEAQLWTLLRRESDAEATAATDPVKAIGSLEALMGNTLSGLGVIHVGRDMATWLITEKLLEVKGTQMFTRLGTPVVVGAGYGNDRIILSPSLVGYRGNEQAEAPSNLFDANKNDLYELVVRDYLLAFEDCGVAAVTVERN